MEGGGGGPSLEFNPEIPLVALHKFPSSWLEHPLLVHCLPLAKAEKARLRKHNCTSV